MSVVNHGLVELLPLSKKECVVLGMRYNNVSAKAVVVGINIFTINEL